MFQFSVIDIQFVNSNFIASNRVIFLLLCLLDSSRFNWSGWRLRCYMGDSGLLCLYLCCRPRWSNKRSRRHGHDGLDLNWFLWLFCNLFCFLLLLLFLQLNGFNSLLNHSFLGLVFLDLLLLHLLLQSLNFLLLSLDFGRTYRSYILSWSSGRVNEGRGSQILLLLLYLCLFYDFKSLLHSFIFLGVH